MAKDHRSSDKQSREASRLEALSEEELRRRAAERGVKDHAEMSRQELLSALRGPVMKVDDDE